MVPLITDICHVLIQNMVVCTFVHNVLYDYSLYYSKRSINMTSELRKISDFTKDCWEHQVMATMNIKNVWLYTHWLHLIRQPLWFSSNFSFFVDVKNTQKAEWHCTEVNSFVLVPMICFVLHFSTRLIKAFVLTTSSWLSYTCIFL